MKRHRENTDNEQAQIARARADEQAQIVRAQARDIALNPSRILPYFSSSDLQSFARTSKLNKNAVQRAMLQRRAAKNNDLKTLKQLTEDDNSFGGLKVRDEEVTWWAAKNSNSRMLRYATEKGYPKHSLVTLEAAKDNNLEMLRYATEKGYYKNYDVAKWAAQHNNLEMLRYATENGYEKPSEVTRWAAQHNNLEMLEYALAQGYDEL